MSFIHFNQLGFRPQDVKKAVIPKEFTEFSILRKADKFPIFKGKTSEPVTDSASSDTVRIADFSSLTEPGEYLIDAGSFKSDPFIISNTPYKELRAALLEMFNYQKCGVDLECGVWSHTACHSELATIYGTNDKKDVSGGWHDAGDYGRYIVPAAKAVADLLLAHEYSPNPDSKLLEIVWFEIEWMLKMQNKQTGGVYHKVSCKNFDAIDEMPHDEKDELFICPVSATATADFAAVMALASRFYPEKKSELLAASKKAWDWCLANPNTEGFQNPPDIHTGGYGDDNSCDERFWAACELFKSSADINEIEKYHNYIKTNIDAKQNYARVPWFPNERRLLSGLGWGNMGTYAVLAYLTSPEEKKDSEINTRCKSELLSDCEKIMEKYKGNPYGISLGDFFAWGSNMTVANNAMMLILGSRFALDNQDKKNMYIEAAKEHFDYLLGRNPLSQSYVTGFGSNPAKNPHHRPSVAKGKTVPGMVVGGPCGHVNRDPAINKYCSDAPPAKRYVDHIESFASNEITIYWNSPVYFVSAVLGF